MFTGLSAFPLTPFSAGSPDEKGFLKILRRLTEAKVDSLGVLGSTGSYAYMTREQRGRIARVAVENAANIPVMVCVGAVSTDEVLRLADDAQQAGASALLLPPVSYQALNDDEVYGLFETVARRASVPLCVYDNPGTTHFTFSDALHGKIASLPGVHSIKIPGVSADAEAAAVRVRNLRDRLPAHVTLGISGDSSAASGLIAGCEVWYSVCGGLFPAVAKKMTEAAAAGDHAAVRQQSERLMPLWALFGQHGGSFRVISAAAGLLGLTDYDCLPRPLLPLRADQLADVKRVISSLELA
ncbi:dihydrodipicolinate synthase family protein [Rouxiella chamberiensis]|uniref:Dihydrodipicolinate synthase family protein n=1 Tax=Rouxiella chamberiensis TaxID=1513468 RepID=A0ABY7HS69_9GAMM|nr:dihydrodipicolinate synthase family protein [Rouxiella chamberiensis]WAT01676.1 dihydrodipicolinate synthase family protein [Rouxiella chamberiensis]